jgi:hypothetical protein
MSRIVDVVVYALAIITVCVGLALVFGPLVADLFAAPAAGPCPPFCNREQRYRLLCADAGDVLLVPAESPAVAWVTKGEQFCAVVPVVKAGPK